MISEARRARWNDTDEAMRYALDPNSYLAGHEVEALVDGKAAYPAMLEAIARAKEYVHFEMYIFRYDDTGKRFLSAFLEARQRGASVRVLLDGFGSVGLPSECLRQMTDAGIEVVLFRPMSDVKSWRRWNRRDHRKVMVVDGEVAFTGGINIGDEYAPREQGGVGWRDTHVRVRGPVVWSLERSFHEIWIRTGGSEYSLPGRKTGTIPGGERCAIAMSDEYGQRTQIRRRLLHAIRQARSYIYIANAYFVPDRRLLRQLIRAVKRGVEVDLLLPAKSDLKTVQWAGEYLYARLLRRGVRIHLWTDAHMHAKTVVIDSLWTTIGSYNLDYVSLFMNFEVVLEVMGEKTGARMKAVFEADRARATALTRKAWKQRGGFQKFLSWFSFQFRRWL